MGDFDLDVDVDMDRRGGGYGRPYDEDRTRAGGYGPGPGGPEQGPPRGGRNTVSGHDLLSGRGRDSEGRPIEPHGEYVVTRAPGQPQGLGAHVGGQHASQNRPSPQPRDLPPARPQPRPERSVLVKVPESALRQLPPGAHVVGDGGQGRHGSGFSAGMPFDNGETDLAGRDYAGYDGGPGMDVGIDFRR